MTRSGALVLGTALTVIGCIFTAQGLGYVSGSPMTGVTLWAVVGPVVALAGIALLVRGARSGRSGPR